ncbi:MAG: hypothetical protein ACR2JW_05975 [Thermomicrobiales bacterium]
MIVFDVLGGATPPAWFTAVIGIVMILFCAYTVHKQSRVLTKSDIATVVGFLIVAGIILLDGLIRLYRH